MCQLYQQTGKLVFTGAPMAPESNERPARKDTIKSYPGYVTRIIQRFDLPHGSAHHSRAGASSTSGTATSSSTKTTR